MNIQGQKQSIVYRQSMRFIIALMLIILALPATANQQKKLTQLSHKIKTIKTQLNKEQHKRNHLQQDLKRAKTNSTKVHFKLQRTRHNLDQQQTKLKQLEHNSKLLQNNLKTQQQLLAKQIRAAYILGRQPYLKLLLNQQSTNKISRMLIYYRYITRNRILTINTTQNTLLLLHQNQQQIKQQYHKLAKLKTRQQAQNNKLKHIAHNREGLIKQVSNQIKSKNKRLDRLINNKRRLAQTIARLEKQARHEKLILKNFAKLRGKLHWPTHGKVLRYFGTKIYRSELRWEGDLIKTKEGQPVYAVASGKVVFAKWLAGYGLLIIVNHGNGYMTLYGRNHSLYKKVGDFVHAGEKIATVGQSGGYKSPALYFAIRHNSQPLNPAKWCAR